ncbi:Ig-like domain-containing protein [Marinobacter sp. V034]|uniref:Ig-like domain-containing protein n=1 Tax=Marinobacter sp. V034 TaxID=3459610 RepID=UPI004043E845
MFNPGCRLGVCAGLATSFLMLSGCGGDDSSAKAADSPTPNAATSDMVAPTVDAVQPADGTVDVERNVGILAQFSEDMLGTSIDDSSVRLSRNGSVIPATVNFDGSSNAVSLTPERPLALLGHYQLTLSATIADLVGNTLATDYTSSFTVRDGAWAAASKTIDNEAGGSWPQIATGPDGSAIAVWIQDDGGADSVWSSRYTPGSGWSQAEAIETSNTVEANYPQIAIDSDGNALAVWEQADSGGHSESIGTNRYTTGVGWGVAQSIGAGTALFASDPQIAFDTDGNAMAVWAEFDGTSTGVLSSRYIAGSGWNSVTEAVDTSGTEDARSPQIVMDANGDVLAVWEQYDGTRHNIWSNRYTVGTGWGMAAERVEASSTEDSREPRIAIDAAGNAITVWQQNDGSHYNIRSSRHVKGSGWSAAENIETGNGAAEKPQIAMDINGNALVVWVQSDGTRSYIWSNRYTASVGWGVAETIEANNAGSALSPQIAIDADGNALAVWHQGLGGYSIWSNRYTVGNGWKATAETIETNGGYASNSQIAIDAEGNGIAVWSQSDGPLESIDANRFE